MENCKDTCKPGREPRRLLENGKGMNEWQHAALHSCLKNAIAPRSWSASLRWPEWQKSVRLRMESLFFLSSGCYVSISGTAELRDSTSEIHSCLCSTSVSIHNLGGVPQLLATAASCRYISSLQKAPKLDGCAPETALYKLSNYPVTNTDYFNFF